ncbi:hypothetical protein B0T14DRAFT_206464 [Immersiella caudata]|uniref:Uncharacterized protein n=1 Tax=Immersiella caudata TaxID=314043 RepID=A0AA39WPS2_9PEZI|nr:hypothetical protein B0T14DRAFT_206464 [Immersiella caudata]
MKSRLPFRHSNSQPCAPQTARGSPRLQQKLQLPGITNFGLFSTPCVTSPQALVTNNAPRAKSDLQQPQIHIAERRQNLPSPFNYAPFMFPRTSQAMTAGFGSALSPKSPPPLPRKKHQAEPPAQSPFHTNSELTNSPLLHTQRPMSPAPPAHTAKPNPAHHAKPLPIGLAPSLIGPKVSRAVSQRFNPHAGQPSPKTPSATLCVSSLRSTSFAQLLHANAHRVPAQNTLYSSCKGP